MFVKNVQKTKNVLLRNFQHIIFVLRQRYWQIFKSVLVYLYKTQCITLRQPKIRKQLFNYYAAPVKPIIFKQ